MPARQQQLGNPAQPGGLSCCCPAAPRCVTRARHDPHSAPPSPAGSRWSQMESHQEHTGTRTVPGWGTRSAQRRGRRLRGAGGLCRALPVPFLPVSDAQSIPVLPSAAGVGDMETPSPLTPPPLSTPTASLNPEDAPPLLPQICWNVGMTPRLQGQPWPSCSGGQGKEQTGLGTHGCCSCPSLGSWCFGLPKRSDTTELGRAGGCKPHNF